MRFPVLGCYSFGEVVLRVGGSGMLDRLAEFSDWLFSEAVTSSALKTLTSTLRFWERAAALRPLATGLSLPRPTYFGRTSW